ncbi:hypothetical protein BGX21_008783 [Mortierella sp. AD011]|nr:hypothetical protein BGX20_010665 [Mortierella sp. AD010]KAF9397522.1 hypothetical protein BGX21_008783 [Mortierella sp. AD011]
MTNQSMMVPPNNTPWPGSQPPPPPTPSSSSSSSSHSHHYPPLHYYHHPGHPPPPHSPHQQPYYPYHPYAAAPYPPYPAYHHPPGHYSQSNEHRDTKSSSFSSSSTVTKNSSSFESNKSTKSVPVPSKSIDGKTESSGSKTGSSTSKGSSSVPTPKIFRFEGSISSETYKTTKSFDLAGVNILNRKPLDTRTALDKLQRRRETHNRVERKRRDCINQLVDDLTKLLPPKHLEEVTSKCHRVNVLRGAVAHIKFLTETNATLKTSLSAAKEKGFVDVDPLQTAPDAEDMTMDIDTSDSKHGDGVEEDKDDEDPAESISSRSSSPTPSSKSRSDSPRLTPSKIMARPLVIVTDSHSPSSEGDPSQSKVTLLPPPISIITESTETQTAESRHKRSNSSSSLSTSPMLPPSDFMTTAGSSSSTFPPSPVSPSPFSRQDPFARKGSDTEGRHNSNKDQQQLSPFTQYRSNSTSPSLPSISSFSDIQSSSESAALSHSSERRSSEHHIPPSLRSDQAPDVTDGKFSNNRTVAKLPPLKIPTQHLHPFSQGANSHDSNKSSQRNNLIPSPLLTPSSQLSSTSPRHHRSGDDQPPISPFMLSPLPRSHSTGPTSPSPGTSPYPHWGQGGSDAPPLPPPHPSHYMPNSLSPHAYPPGYPYPYPYHPSYGYPHPHGPPPPHHHAHLQHGPPPAHPAQQKASSPQPAPARSPQPEPIFIQEEPWIVQRKRSTPGTSSTSNKAQPSSSSAKSSGKKTLEKDEEDDCPMSPSSSVTSGASLSITHNAKKRSSNVENEATTKLIPGSPKRSKLQQKTPDLSPKGESQVRAKDGDVVVVVVGTDSETTSAEEVELVSKE